MDILLDVLFALELLRPIKPFRIWMCATSFKRLDKFDLLEYNLRIILGAVHKLCRLGKGGRGVAPKTIYYIDLMPCPSM